MGTRHLTLVGYLTWAIIGDPERDVGGAQHHSLGAPHAGVWAVCFVAFIVAVRPQHANENPRPADPRPLQSAPGARSASAMQPLGGMQPVLLVIVAGQLGGMRLGARRFRAAQMAGAVRGRLPLR